MSSKTCSNDKCEFRAELDKIQIKYNDVKQENENLHKTINALVKTISDNAAATEKAARSAKR